MITPLTLHDAVCDFLEEKVASRFKLRQGTRKIHENKNYINPKVKRSGWIISINHDGEGSEDEAYPYIMPRIHKVRNIENERESIVILDVHFGVFDPGVYEDDEKGSFVDDGSGYRDFWNLVEATRQAFFMQVIIDNKYRIIGDFFEAEMIEEQIYPYWEGYCRTKWHIVYPLPRLN